MRLRDLVKRDRRDGQIIDAGKVWCPNQQRDVSVELCLSCGAFQGFVASDGVDLLVCRSSRVPDAALPI